MAETKKTKTNDDIYDLLKSIKNMLIVIICLLAILTCVVSFRNFCTCDCSCHEEQTDVPQLDPSQGEYVEPEKEVNHSKNVIMPGWTEFRIAAGTTEITKGIDFYNPEGNHWYKCPDCGDQLDDNFKCTNEKCGHQFDEKTAVLGDYYMTFALYLKDGDELLYKSGLVAPGKHIQKITLNRALSAGEYDAYVFLQPYLSDMKTECNNGKVVIKLKVE